MLNANIIVLVLGTQNREYDSFKNAIRNSWLKAFKAKGIPVFFYEGGYNTTELADDTIKLDVKDDLQSTALKMSAAFQFVLNKFPKTTHIYRTNLSSYLDVGNFIQFIEKTDQSQLAYLGHPGQTTILKEKFYLKSKILTLLFTYLKIGTRIDFASGSGFFISKENVEFFLKAKIDNSFIDDVFLGKVLGVKIKPDSAPLRFDILEDDKHKIPKSRFNELLNAGSLFHYRFKTVNRENDALLLQRFSDKAFLLNTCCNESE
jgi:hypothetical protein